MDKKIETPKLKVTNNSDKFRGPAIFFQRNQQYTFAPVGTSEYIKYWTTEREYCMNGYTAEDGDRIPGHMYFYLNYYPIDLAKEVDVMINGKMQKRSSKERDFPRFYDYDRWFFELIEHAEIIGRHLSVVKARRKGYSFKVSSLLIRAYYFYRNSKSFALAAETEYLVRDGILSKAWDSMDFIDQHTAWYKKRQKSNTKMHRRASYVQKDESGVEIEMGYKSEIFGVTLKNDPDKARGKAGKYIVFEEAGSFNNLLHGWQVARESVEQGSLVFGTMCAFGCVCEGTKVYDKNGLKKNIEDIKQEDGILGYNSYSTVPLEIEKFREPHETECYKITTNSGRTLECSYDHPIAYSTYKMVKEIPGKRNGDKRFRMKSWKWREAEKIKINDQVGISEEIPFFGKLEMWEPRVIGWLIGDGSYGPNKTPILSSADKEVNGYIEGKLDTITEKFHKTKDGRDYKETRIRSIVHFLKDLGIYGQTKNKKRLPVNYDLFNKNSLAEMLGGLFDADGYITDPLKRTEISLTAAHKEILLEVLDLLQKFAVNGKISYIKPSKNGKGKNGHYKLTIRDKYSLVNFIDNIKFSIEAKKERADRLEVALTFIKSAMPRYISGIRFERVINVEGIGKKKVYNIQASEYHTYIANGFITHNTGGDMGEGLESLKELFERPKAYGCLELDNIWDEELQGQICGFFVPAYANLEGVYENREDKNDPLNGTPFMDKDGNTNIRVAKKYVLLKRMIVAKNATDRRAVDRAVAENPIVPKEALMDHTSNIFPKVELQRHLATIRNDKRVTNYKQVGDLYFDNDGVVRFQLEADILKQKDLTKYKLDPNENPMGQVVIWEHPKKNPPWGLYIAGCLTPGEKVNTKEGLKNVEDITLDDQLISKDGDFVDINTLLRYEKENEPTYKVYMHNIDRPTNYTQEHPLYVADNPDDKFDFVRARDVKNGSWNKAPNFYRLNSKSIDTSIWESYSQKYTSKIDNPLEKEDFWWFVGHWLGDGFNHNQGRNFTIYNSFGKDETEYVNKYKQVVSNLFSRKPHLKKQNGSNTHKFESKQLYMFLEDNFGKYADGKYISEWVKFIPEEYKKQLVLGYLDADGSVYMDRDRLKSSFKSINRTLLNDVQDILFSIGIVSSFYLSESEGIYSIKGKTGIKKESYRLALGQTETIKLQELFDSNYSSRKLRKISEEKEGKHFVRGKYCYMSDDLDYIYIKISGIEEGIYTGTVYNFDCVTHTFICQYFSGHNCDPYDHDKSGTNSLGSIFIYKRLQEFDEYYELPVAEYTGRPNTANEFYEIVRKLLLYYNATLMYENEKKGLFFYFERMNCTHLLADQPNDLIGDIVKDSSVQRKKGIHMNTSIKDWGEGAIRDWLVEEYSPGKMNLTKILSPALLEELIFYNDKGNFDRCVVKGTKIHTIKGFSNIEDVKVGDSVLTHTGKYKEVIWTDKSIRNKDLIKIDLVGLNEPIEVTSNHPLLVASVTTKKHNTRIKALNNINWENAEDILNASRKYNFLLSPKRKNMGVTSMGKDLLYLIGWMLADGSISKGQIRITLGEHQESIADKLCSIIDKYTEGYSYNKRKESKTTKKRYITETGGYIRISKNCLPFAKFLESVGCQNNNKHIETSLYNSQNLIPLVIGYLEGDGHQKNNFKYDGNSKSVIECSSIYKDLINQVRQIMIDNGIWSSVSSKRRKGYSEQYNLNISGRYVDKLLSYYPSLKFEIKSYSKKHIKNNQLETEEGFWVPIKSIQYSDKKDEYVYNIEVKDDHSYVANGCVNHNCMAFMCVMIYKEQLHKVKVNNKRRMNQRNTQLFSTSIFTEEAEFSFNSMRDEDVIRPGEFNAKQFFK